MHFGDQPLVFRAHVAGEVNSICVLPPTSSSFSCSHKSGGGESANSISSVGGDGAVVFVTAGTEGGIKLWDVARLAEELKELNQKAQKESGKKAKGPPLPPYCTPLAAVVWCREISEVTTLDGNTIAAIADRDVAVFDLTDFIVPKKSYRHAVELCAFGRGLDQTQTGGCILPSGNDFLNSTVSLLDEDGAIYSVSREGLRLARLPFGSQKNIGSGLALGIAPPLAEAAGEGEAGSSSSPPQAVVLSVAMDSKLHCYQPVVETSTAVEGDDTKVSAPSIDWRRAKWALSAELDVGGLTEVGTGPAATGGGQQFSNPPLVTSLSVAWPFAAMGRADGTYVVAEVLPTPTTTSTKKWGLELALSSPGHPTNGLVAAEWVPSTTRRLLATVALSGEISIWDVGPMLTVNEEGADDDDGEVRCVYAEDVRPYLHPLTREHTVVNVFTFLPSSSAVDGGGDAVASIPPFVVGCSDGTVLVFPSSSTMESSS